MNAPADTPLAWDIDIPLVTNGALLRSILGVSFGAAGLVGALVAWMLLVQGAWDLVPRLLLLAAAGGLGLFLLALGVMLLMLGNRFRARFVIDAEGVHAATRDRAAQAGNRGALLLGLMLGRPAAAGSGLLAMRQESQTLKWSGAFRAEVDATGRSIVLRNRWRTLLRVYCTPQNFEAVQRRVAECMAAHGTAARAAGPSPMAGYLVRTALVVLACLPLFLLAPVYGHGLFLPLLLMCFAIATVWFVRYLAWVVLGSALVLAVNMLGTALAWRGASIFSGVRYRRYETLSGDDWALTVLAALGLAWLAWQAVQTLRRRLVPALESDMLDSTG
ncbi:hypothetical protein [Aquabacterium sp.]|uniref:hypothetical protein n=1 Tax=Aquabacterium sp. TaxID=1872578 RepID=UPI003783D18E